MTETISGEGELRIGESVLNVGFTVPTGKCPPLSMLPDVQRFADQITDYAESRMKARGLKISCTKGCGACCRQMAPVTPSEAQHLAALVEKMPPERAMAVRARFAGARATMSGAGLRPQGHPDEDKTAYREYGLSYFKKGVACPFLEAESCSIYADRPLVCREYLVTSPPAGCAVLGSGQVRKVSVPIQVWAAFGRSSTLNRKLKWMPLIESLAYAEAHPAPEPERTGPQHVEAFLKEIQGMADCGEGN